jgi:hypothetical protein
MSTTAAMTSRLGPFGPGFFRTADENSRRYFRVVSARWRRRRVDAFQDDGHTDQPAWAHEQRTHADDNAVSETEVGGTSPGAIENQQLLLDQYGLGHHGTRPARTGEPGESRQDVEKQDGQVAHGTILTIWRNPGNAKEFGIRHAQADT